MARDEAMRPSVRIAYAVAVAALALAVALASMIAFSQMRSHTEPDPSGALAAEDAGDGFPAVDWDYWQGVNPAVIGWITIPDTTVDYPIVQAPAEDPDYYLTHDVYGNWNYVGVPYLDAGCADGLASENAAIFAHHIKVGEPMFAPVASYTDEAFAREHAVMLIQTPDEKRKLDVSAAAKINGSSRTKRTSFEDREDFRAWYSARIGEAQMVLDASVPVRTTTLITCSYSSRNERTVVYAADARDIPLTAAPASLPAAA